MNDFLRSLLLLIVHLGYAGPRTCSFLFDMFHFYHSLLLISNNLLWNQTKCKLFFSFLYRSVFCRVIKSHYKQITIYWVKIYKRYISQMNWLSSNGSIKSFRFSYLIALFLDLFVSSWIKYCCHYDKLHRL